MLHPGQLQNLQQNLILRTFHNFTTERASVLLGPELMLMLRRLIWVGSCIPSITQTSGQPSGTDLYVTCFPYRHHILSFEFGGFGFWRVINQRVTESAESINRDGLVLRREHELLKVIKIQKEKAGTENWTWCPCQNTVAPLQDVKHRLCWVPKEDKPWPAGDRHGDGHVQGGHHVSLNTHTHTHLPLVFSVWEEGQKPELGELLLELINPWL